MRSFFVFMTDTEEEFSNALKRFINIVKARYYMHDTGEGKGIDYDKYWFAYILESDIPDRNDWRLRISVPPPNMCIDKYTGHIGADVRCVRDFVIIDYNPEYMYIPRMAVEIDDLGLTSKGARLLEEYLGIKLEGIKVRRGKSEKLDRYYKELAKIRELMKTMSDEDLIVHLNLLKDEYPDTYLDIVNTLYRRASLIRKKNKWLPSSKTHIIDRFIKKETEEQRLKKLFSMLPMTKVEGRMVWKTIPELNFDELLELIDKIKSMRKRKESDELLDLLIRQLTPEQRVWYNEEYVKPFREAQVQNMILMLSSLRDRGINILPEDLIMYAVAEEIDPKYAKYMEGKDINEIVRMLFTKGITEVNGKKLLLSTRVRNKLYKKIYDMFRSEDYIARDLALGFQAEVSKKTKDIFELAKKRAESFERAREELEKMMERERAIKLKRKRSERLAEYVRSIKELRQLVGEIPELDKIRRKRLDFMASVALQNWGGKDGRVPDLPYRIWRKMRYEWGSQTYGALTKLIKKWWAEEIYPVLKETKDYDDENKYHISDGEILKLLQFLIRVGLVTKDNVVFDDVYDVETGQLIDRRVVSIHNKSTFARDIRHGLMLLMSGKTYDETVDILANMKIEDRLRLISTLKLDSDKEKDKEKRKIIRRFLLELHAGIGGLKQAFTFYTAKWTPRTVQYKKERVTTTDIYGNTVTTVKYTGSVPYYLEMLWNIYRNKYGQLGGINMGEMTYRYNQALKNLSEGLVYAFVKKLTDEVYFNYKIGNSDMDIVALNINGYDLVCFDIKNMGADLDYSYFRNRDIMFSDVLYDFFSGNQVKSGNLKVMYVIMTSYGVYMSTKKKIEKQIKSVYPDTKVIFKTYLGQIVPKKMIKHAQLFYGTSYGYVQKDIVANWVKALIDVFDIKINQ